MSSVSSGSPSLTCYWRERAIWLLVNAYLGVASCPSGVSDVMGMGSVRSLPLRTDRQSNHISLDSYLQTARLVMGGGAG
jgi:hypothetical protein